MSGSRRTDTGVSDPEIRTKVFLDDAMHRFLVRVMNRRQPIPWPGINFQGVSFREGEYIVEAVDWDGSAFETVTVIPT